MRILVTGATGFIGRAFCRVASARGHELVGLSRNPHAAATGLALPPAVGILPGSLEDTPWAEVERNPPDAVLHLAWTAEPGVYLHSPENQRWLEQSRKWFRRMKAMGVQRIAGTGTGIEYAASLEPLNEDTSAPGPVHPYSIAKRELFEWLRAEEAGPAWNWFRVFYPYGPGEHPQRICTSLIRGLETGGPLELRTPHSMKDYLFIDDVALGICMALESGKNGAVNIGSGTGVSIHSLAVLITKMLGRDPALVRHSVPLAEDPTPVVVADNTRLRSFGWKPMVTLEAGIQRLIDRLRAAT